MTHQEKFEELYKQFAEKSDTLIKAHKEATSTNGFGEFYSVPTLLKADEEFKIAGNNYHSFLAYCKENNVDPNGEFSSN